MNAVAHFLVDGVCAATLFGRLGNDPDLSMLIMLYSTLAFSTQGLVGIIADRVKRHLQADVLALITVAAGFFIPLPPLLTVIVVSVGNSVFHVAGGAMTLEDSGGEAGALGVFVAPGTIGLNIGTLWPASGLTMAIALFLCAAGLGVLGNRRTVRNRGDARPNPPSALDAIILLTLSVAVRAIGGIAVVFPWNITSGMAMLLTLFVFAGKTTGGMMCDRIGVRLTVTASIIPAALLIAFCSKWIIPSLIGQFLLNLSMPVTLWLLYRAMPDSPGFAFGLAASALWPGTLVGRMMTSQAMWVCVLVS